MSIVAKDLIGIFGVTLLLLAFLLNAMGRLDKTSRIYILMNLVGAALACWASLIINYLPFVVLEGAWALVALVALVKSLSKSPQ
ncbi:MAG: hypothetical protein U0V74_10560 [Chitinophagales bacterium]